MTMNKNIINLLKSILLILGLLLISSIIINILYYFDIINNNFIKYLKMILSIISFFIGGIYIGRKSISKGYINGLKLSLIIVIISLILGVIFNNLKLSRIIYYILTTISITFGSMIGINKKES